MTGQTFAGGRGNTEAHRGGRGGCGSMKSIQKYGFFLFSFRTSPCCKTTSERSNELGLPKLRFRQFLSARRCFLESVAFLISTLLSFQLPKLGRDVPHDPLSQIKIGIEKGHGTARSEGFFLSFLWFLFSCFYSCSRHDLLRGQKCVVDSSTWICQHTCS